MRLEWFGYETGMVWDMTRDSLGTSPDLHGMN